MVCCMQARADSMHSTATDLYYSTAGVLQPCPALCWYWRSMVLTDAAVLESSRSVEML